jgi:hypothetical protein
VFVAVIIIVITIMITTAYVLGYVSSFGVLVLLLCLGYFKYNLDTETWIVYIVHRNCLLKRVIEGKIEGKVEGARRRGRRRKQLLHDFEEKRRYGI